jgi:Tfp pilus assembly protein PilX
MSTAVIIVAVVAAVVVAVLTICTLALVRRRELRHRFGTEYHRVVDASDSKLKAEAGLKERERRVRDLDIRPLTNSARESYADQWAAVQEQFVDAPADAVAASRVLVIAVMSERGYPTDRPDQVLADLSVEHASTLDRYRSAEQTSGSTASTEDLRLAMIDYRALFRDLLGESDVLPGSSAPAALAAEPDDTGRGTDPTQVAEAQVPLAVGDSRSDEPIRRSEGRAGSTRPTDAGEPADDANYASQTIG